MSFDPNIPVNGQSPSLFPAQCRTNWGRLKTIIEKDHKFNLGADPTDGEHLQISVLNRSEAAGVVPGVTAGANSMAYGSGTRKLGTSVARSEMFFTRAAGIEFLTTGIRAAVLFDPASLGALLFSHNVSAVGGGSGFFDITFPAGVMPTANYITVGMAKPPDPPNHAGQAVVNLKPNFSQTVTQCSIVVTSSSGSIVNAQLVGLLFFGG